MLNIAICDNESLFCNLIQEYIIEFLQKKQIKDYNIQTFFSGEEILANDTIFDIAFLDVEMSGISGIHAGRELKKRNSRTLVFIITAFDDYIDEAFKFHAFRFLSKPLDKQRLFRNFNDALYLYHTQNKKVAIETKDSVHTLLTTDIIMIESRNRKAVIYTFSGTYTSIYGINYYAELLQDYCFFKTHKSFLVNLEHVVSFNSNTVTMTGGLTAYLTVRLHTKFKTTYLNYLDATNE